MMKRKKTKDRKVKDVINQAKITQWLFHNGMFEASRNRTKFTKMLNKTINDLDPKAPKLHDIDVFTPEVHKNHPLLGQLWEKGVPEKGIRPFKEIWFDKYEPSKLEQNDLIIDIRKVNEIIRSFGGEEFSFGGLEWFHAMA